MKTLAKVGVLVVSMVLVLSAAGLDAAQKESKGAKLFQQHCSACHPNGGNIIKPAETLHKKDRDAHGVKTAKNIVGKMRNPGPGPSPAQGTPDSKIRTGSLSTRSTTPASPFTTADGGRRETLGSSRSPSALTATETSVPPRM